MILRQNYLEYEENNRLQPTGSVPLENKVDPFGAQTEQAKQRQAAVNDAVSNWKIFGYASDAAKELQDYLSAGVTRKVFYTDAFPFDVGGLYNYAFDVILMGKGPFECTLEYLSKQDGIDYESRDEAIEFAIAHELYHRKIRRETKGASGGTQDDANKYAREQMYDKLRTLREEKNNAWASWGGEGDHSNYCGFIPSVSLYSELETLGVLVEVSPGQITAGYKEGGFGGIGIAKTIEKIPKEKTLLFTQMLVNEVTFDAASQHKYYRISKHEVR